MTPLDEGGVLLVVCDGMGGMGHGDLASQIAVDTIIESVKREVGFPTDRLAQSLRVADVEVREQLCDGSRGFPGSTAVVVYLIDGLAHVAWAGDSRAYLIRGGNVVERTRDHKLVEDLIDAGQISREDAASSSVGHIVTRALGARSIKERPLTPATVPQPWKLQHGDAILLCSDGLCDLVTDDEIPSLVGSDSPDLTTKALVQTALERGGHDNITVVFARWDGDDYIEDDHATPAFMGREMRPGRTAKSENRPGSFSRPVTEELDPNWRPPSDQEEEDVDDDQTLPTLSTPIVAALPKVAAAPKVPADPPSAPQAQRSQSLWWIGLLAVVAFGLIYAALR